MSKFQVIEESRFLKNKELADLKGGDWSCELPYSTCRNQGITYETCGTWNTVAIYHVGPCVTQLFTCNPYTNCNPEHGITTCGGSTAHTVIIEHIG